MTKRTKKQVGQEMVDAGRAAEILGYSYNAIMKAIDSGVLAVAMFFERKGGGTSPLIRKADLENYRETLVQRYETMPQYADRLADLKRRTVLT